MSKIKPIIKDVKEIRKLKNGLKEYRVEVEFKISYKTETPYTPLKRTRKHHQDEIDVFMDHIMSLWSLYPYVYAKNMDAFTSNPISKEFSNNELRDYYMHGEIISSVLGICIDEFQNYLYEIQIGVYNGAIRTLRYILEVTIDCCLFQTDYNRHNINHLNKFATSKNNVKSYMNYHNNWVSFIERYKLYEDTRRIAPTFKEKINKLNSKNIFLQAPVLHSKIKDMYGQLSNYVHPNIQRIKRHIIRNTLPPPNYEETEFNNAYKIGLEVLDITTYIFIKTITCYYDFKSYKECIKNYAETLQISEFIDNHFNLNYTSKLCNNIKRLKAENNNINT